MIALPAFVWTAPKCRGDGARWLARQRVRSLLAVLAFQLCGAALVAGPAAAAPPADRVFTVAGNHGSPAGIRFGVPATRSAFLYPRAVLALPGNGFLLEDLDHSRVLRVDTLGILHPFIGTGREGDSGNDGPAVRARMWGAGHLVRRTDGSVVMIDVADGDVRVVTADGVIHRLWSIGIGTADHGLAALPDNSLVVVDGEHRRLVRIDAAGHRSVVWTATGGEDENRPDAVAATADGTLVFSTYNPPQLLRRAPDGSVRTLRAPFFAGTQLVGEPDGTVLAATGGADAITLSPTKWIDAEPLVWRLSPDGAASVIAGPAFVEQGFDGDGEAPLDVNMGADDVSRTDDGGLLVAGYEGVRYIAPENPALLAVAITRNTLTSPSRPKVTFASTRAATVTIAIHRHGRTVVSARRRVEAGDGVGASIGASRLARTRCGLPREAPTGP
jgi:hypothetical protein